VRSQSHSIGMIADHRAKHAVFGCAAAYTEGEQGGEPEQMNMCTLIMKVTLWVKMFNAFEESSSRFARDPSLWR
jgi:hypothetical protein